jgi:hypothetical protein
MVIPDRHPTDEQIARCGATIQVHPIGPFAITHVNPAAQSIDRLAESAAICELDHSSPRSYSRIDRRQRVGFMGPT